MLIISLPVPPSSNMAYRNVPGIGRVKTSDHRAWKREAGIIAKLQYRQQGSPAIEKPYRMLIKVNINRRGDIMNREKLLTDLLVELGIIPDDCWCDEITIYRSNAIPGCEVVIDKLGLGSGDPAPPRKGSGLE
jgi:Holliday junction resolvase RusA-like endonuclease